MVYPMRSTRNEDGFLLVEVIAAMMIITIALLALICAYSFGWFAIGAAGTNTSAGLIANDQLELSQSLSYSSTGLSSTPLTSVESTDPTYCTDKLALPGSSSPCSTADVTYAGCTSTLTQCKPVQTVTGSDNKPYKVETFIRLLSTRSDGATRSEKVVTVVVRNASASSTSKVLTMQTAFDSGT